MKKITSFLNLIDFGLWAKSPFAGPLGPWVKPCFTGQNVVARATKIVQGTHHSTSHERMPPTCAIHGRAILLSPSPVFEGEIAIFSIVTSTPTQTNITDKNKVDYLIKLDSY